MNGDKKAQARTNHPQFREVRKNIKHRATAIKANAKFAKYKISAMISSKGIGIQCFPIYTLA